MKYREFDVKKLLKKLKIFYFLFITFQKALSSPQLKNFSSSNKVPYTIWHNQFFSNLFRYVGKNCFVEIFSFFSNKKFWWKIKNVPLSKLLLNFDIFSLNQSNISIKRVFCWNFYFHWKFFPEKREKISTKQFFSIYLNKLGKI